MRGGAYYTVRSSNDPRGRFRGEPCVAGGSAGAVCFCDAAPVDGDAVVATGVTALGAWAGHEPDTGSADDGGGWTIDPSDRATPINDVGEIMPASLAAIG